jgi:hypothetical protein
MKKDKRSFQDFLLFAFSPSADGTYEGRYSSAIAFLSGFYIQQVSFQL